MSQKIDSVLEYAIDELKIRSDRKDGLSGVPSGFSALDRITSGWQSSELIIIASRPGMGKNFIGSLMCKERCY